MENERVLKDSILEALAVASLQGHNLAPFEEVTDRITGGYEARCRRCGQTTWVSVKGVRYSLLSESCQGYTKSQEV